MVLKSDTKILLRLLSTDRDDAMEAAKWIIANPGSVPVGILADIAGMKTMQTWSRICAVYAIGFTGKSGLRVDLVSILLDESNAHSLRSFAAEALGNLHAEKASEVLRTICNTTKNAELKKSCKYALSQFRA